NFKCRKEHNSKAEDEVPISERASTGVVKNEWRRDQPQSARRFKALFPATQIQKLERAEGQHEDADYCGVDRHGLTNHITAHPRGQHDKGAQAHADAIFPGVVNVKETMPAMVSSNIGRTSAAKRLRTPKLNAAWERMSVYFGQYTCRKKLRIFT